MQMLKVLTNKEHCKGRFGEFFVCLFYFLFKSSRLVKSRYKTKSGEIDLIFRRGKLIIFCEVKTRIGLKNEMNFVENLVSEKQMQRIRNAAMEFIKTDKRYRKMDKRFDIAVVNSFFRYPKIFENYNQKSDKFYVL